MPLPRPSPSPVLNVTFKVSLIFKTYQLLISLDAILLPVLRPLELHQSLEYVDNSLEKW